MAKKQKNKTEPSEIINFLQASIAQVEKDQTQARNFIKLGNERKRILRDLMVLVKKK